MVAMEHSYFALSISLIILCNLSNIYISWCIYLGKYPCNHLDCSEICTCQNKLFLKWCISPIMSVNLGSSVSCPFCSATVVYCAATYLTVMSVNSLLTVVLDWPTQKILHWKTAVRYHYFTAQVVTISDPHSLSDNSSYFV